jgi:malonyl-CoA O-methyltransferase
MNMSELYKKSVQRSFARSVNTYDQAATLQRHVGDALSQRLGDLRATPQRILEIGCATGFCTQLLRQRYPQAAIVALDIAFPMLHHANRRMDVQPQATYICADAMLLPFQESSFDLIFSNLTLQWLTHLPTFFTQLRTLLKQDGYLMMTSLGPNTFKELRASWEGVDLYQHVHEFASIQEIGDYLLQAHFQDPVLDVDNVIVNYPDLKTLFHTLKALGANNRSSHRPLGLMGKTRWQQFLRNYQQNFEKSGKIPATYQVIFIHAGARSELGQEKSAEVSFPISELRRRILSS